MVCLWQISTSTGVDQNFELLLLDGLQLHFAVDAKCLTHHDLSKLGGTVGSTRSHHSGTLYQAGCERQTQAGKNNDTSAHAKHCLVQST